MKIIKVLKYSGLLALVLGIAVGCAGTPSEQGATQADAQAAIQAAKDAYKKAENADYAWRDTGKMIKQAEELEAKGDYDGAVKLADKARRQSENALAQKQEEEQRLSSMMATGGTQTKPMASSDQYTVMRGDCLWNIAGKDSIYGNPYEWPLIYKANQDKIKDADLIYPGQVFSINRSASSAEIEAAVHHAKTRGSWSLGVVEESDKAYLAQ
ncbi:MAG TPA: hypothetical protein VKA50_03310 [Gammaproteobacteria bacterium]|nr:hypothetical protein [Gammaproteobacteria bacterium]